MKYTRTHLAPAGTFAPLHTTHVIHKPVALRTADFRLIAHNPSHPGAMGQLCNDLRTYGCNVNPMRMGTTGR